MPAKRQRMARKPKKRAGKRPGRKVGKPNSASIIAGRGRIYKFPSRYVNYAQAAIAGAGVYADGSYCEYTTDANGANFILICNHATESNYGTLIITPQLTSVYNYTEFTTLFQEFRIVRYDIDIMMYPTTTQATGAASSDTGQVLIHSAPYTNAAPGIAAGTSDQTCVGALRQYNGYTCRNAYDSTGKPVHYSVTTPMVLIGAVPGVNSALMTSPWLACTSNGNAVQHIGRAFVFEYWNSTAGAGDYIPIKVEGRIYLEFRNTN